MKIGRRHILLGPGETLADVDRHVDQARATTLAELDAAGASDFQRATRRDRLTLRELYAELRAIIHPLEQVTGDESLAIEYFSIMYQYDAAEATRPRYSQRPRPIPPLTEDTTLETIPYRWIAVFPVTGGNEGHYVHVDLMWDRDYQDGRIPLFLLKTFGGHDAAVTLAGMLARVLGV